MRPISSYNGSTRIYQFYIYLCHPSGNPTNLLPNWTFFLLLVSSFSHSATHSPNYSRRSTAPCRYSGYHLKQNDWNILENIKRNVENKHRFTTLPKSAKVVQRLSKLTMSNWCIFKQEPKVRKVLFYIDGLSTIPSCTPPVPLGASLIGGQKSVSAAGSCF
jgi:hypothetical protein